MKMTLSISSELVRKAEANYAIIKEIVVNGLNIRKYCLRDASMIKSIINRVIEWKNRNDVHGIIETLDNVELLVIVLKNLVGEEKLAPLDRLINVVKKRANIVCECMIEGKEDCGLDDLVELSNTLADVVICLVNLICGEVIK